ncbi:alpha/beta fold hydrolase [Flavobacterium sp. CS20]|uniref:alpha/beta fold hydrolase n=1 Tax=Flavobacterium sp. CS20 TaxID=2775246 RepID=UPI001B3A12E1|nr:alpha/beta hydrolase [Flavobacterium sp. CS20]QTY26696.1 alpha/beta hydrolase [Flavobacterium sp. CS20]
MEYKLEHDGKFKFIEIGEGTPIIILHGLMGGLSNFDGVVDFFPKQGYKVVIPELPIYTLPILKTNIKNISTYIKEFIDYKQYKDVILLGNSLGGHIGLLTTKLYPESAKALIITGDSGLYESAMGESYPKRSNYNYIKKKAENVFYDPKIATKEIVDDVYKVVNDRSKLIRTLAIAKSAIRHNMSKDLPNIHQPTCIIWGKQDNVTPPNVAEEFHEKLPNSDLFWIDKCGHLAMMEHPEQFNSILHSWLQKREL